MMGGKNWTPAELDVIRTYYTTTPRDELLRLLPNRTWFGVEAFALKNNLRRMNVNRFKNSNKEYDFSDFEVGFLVGILEGEGTITIHKSDRRKGGTLVICPGVSIYNTNEDLISECKRILSKLVDCRVYRHSDKGENARTQIELCVSRYWDTHKLLNKLKPYLVSKKKQAELVLEFIKIRNSAYSGDGYGKREFEICDEMKRLNKRGR